MPRLSIDRYLQLYTALHDAWLSNRQVFGYLPTQDQYYLHRFFQLSHELTSIELVAHRRQVSAEQPSLPHCAGRALARLAEGQAEHRQHGRMVVYPVVRPEPDVRRLVTVLVHAAQQLQGYSSTCAK